MPLTILNPRKIALLLDPCYPSYAESIHLAGGPIHTMPLLAENQLLQILADSPTSVLAKVRFMVLNYPHNPTTDMASLSFFEETVKFYQQYNLVLVHDFFYADIVFNEIKLPPSIL